MYETASLSPPTPEAPPQQTIREPAQQPLAGPRGRWGGCLALLAACWALPRALIRHPLRSLGISLLVALIVGGLGLAGVSLWANYHLRCARTAMERYHTREAVQHLNSCMTIWPRNSEALLLAARAARRSRRFHEADHCLDMYQEQLGKGGKNDPALTIERVCLRAERGEVDNVIQFCTSLIAKEDPDCPLIWEALARGFSRMYRPVEAEGVLKEWLQHQPDNVQALLIRADINDMYMRQHEALADYRRILELDKDMDEARLRMCSTLIAMSLYHEALPQLEYLNRRLPGNSHLQVDLARTLEETSQSKEAEAILDEVLARDPRFAAALALRGKLAMNAKRYDEAEKLFRQAVAVEPSDIQTQFQLYKCLEKNDKPEEAQQVNARIDQLKKDIERIQAISTQEMQLNPRSPQLRYEAGTIALRAGAVEEGLRWLYSALKEDPDHAASHKALMEHYERIGDHTQAALHRRKAKIAEPKP